MISNATPLICLSKAKQLRLLKEVYGTVLIPEAVQKEVVILGRPGALQVQEAINQDWIIIQHPREVLQLSLGRGETEAISLAKEKGETLLIDDAHAIAAAEIHGITTLRTTTVVLTACSQKIITPEEALAIINELIKEGYYTSPAHYIVLVEKLKAISK